MEMKESGLAHIEALPSAVKVNVGGEVFETSKSSLLRCETSLLYQMAASGEWMADKEGELTEDALLCVCVCMCVLPT